MPLYVLLFKQSIIHKGINKTKAQPEGTQETICNRDFRRHNLIRAQNNRKMLKPSPQFRQARHIAVSSNITFLKKLFCIGNDRHTSVQSANVDKYEMCVRDFLGVYTLCVLACNSYWLSFSNSVAWSCHGFVPLTKADWSIWPFESLLLECLYLFFASL